MNRTALLLGILAALTTPLAAQVSVNRPAPATPAAAAPPPSSSAASADADVVRTTLGITVTTSGTDRDTLGLLVAAVAAGSGSQRSGVEPGNRLADINGTSLRIGAASVGRREARDDAVRRFAEVVRGASDSVSLRLFGGGKYRTVFVAVPHRAAAPAPVAVADATAHPLTVASVIEIVNEAQSQIQRLMEDTLAKPLALDTMMWAQAQLGLIARRLQATRELPPPPPPAPAVVAPAAATAAAVAAPPAAPAGDASIPGIRTTPVTDELTDYFGAESRGGILVLDADSTWAPVRKGDVILRINGQRATTDALRAASTDRTHPAQVDLLRRGRYLMVTVHAGG